MSLPQISALDTARSGRETTTGIASNGANPAANGTELRSEFLQMMVAQIQNQDPLNPLDGTQYVSQLAQFSMVEGGGKSQGAAAENPGVTGHPAGAGQHPAGGQRGDGAHSGSVAR